MQPLALPRETRRLAVVRLESDPDLPPELSAEQRRQVVRTVLAWHAAPPGFAGLQIDFDATVSQRGFYRRLLADLHRQLPPGTPLSITRTPPISTPPTATWRVWTWARPIDRR